MRIAAIIFVQHSIGVVSLPMIHSLSWIIGCTFVNNNKAMNTPRLHKHSDIMWHNDPDSLPSFVPHSYSRHVFSFVYGCVCCHQRCEHSIMSPIIADSQVERILHTKFSNNKPKHIIHPHSPTIPRTVKQNRTYNGPLRNYPRH